MLITQLLRPLSDDMSSDDRRACAAYYRVIRSGLKQLDADAERASSLT